MGGQFGLRETQRFGLGGGIVEPLCAGALCGRTCEQAGFSRLARAGKSTVWRILDENDLKPHKIRYYLEKRDPDFDRKMHEVLMVYRDVSLYTEGCRS